MDLNEQRVASFCERVRVRLAVLNSSRSSLAASMGITRQRLWQILEDPYACSVRTLDPMAEALGVTTAWLLDGELRDALPDITKLPEEVTT